MATRREFLRLAGLAAGAAALGSLGGARAAESVPPKLNLLFILVDGMGQRDLGCYGSTFYETPAMGARAEGMRRSPGS